MQQPFPTSKFLDRFYTYDYYRGLYWGTHTAPADDVAKRHSMSLERLQFLAKQKPFIAGTRILDFGSGVGAFIEECKEKYPAVEILGIDPGTQVSAPKSLGLFDVISLIHVLEHLHDPVQTLKELSRLLKPDGVMFVEVPDIAAQQLPHNFHIAHVAYFTEKTLSMAFEAAGLAVLSHAPFAARNALYAIGRLKG